MYSISQKKAISASRALPTKYRATLTASTRWLCGCALGKKWAIRAKAHVRLPRAIFALLRLRCSG